MSPRRSNAVCSRLLGAAAFCAAALFAVVFPESRAQIPPELVQTAPGYNSQNSQFNAPDLCRKLGGQIASAPNGDNVCTDIDQHNTFCIVGSAQAFPCRGLFKHVIQCNAQHNRPALNPFLCAEKCSENAAPPQKALGGQCRKIIPPQNALVPPAVSAAFANGAIILEQPDQTYTISLPQNLPYARQNTRALRLLAPEESPQFTATPDITSSVPAELFCGECYPTAFTLIAEFHNPLGAQLRSAKTTVTAQTPTLRVTHWVVSEVENADPVETLLSRGVTARDPDGQTPLHYAASLNASLLAERLLTEGAQIDAQDNQGRTPLDIAIAENSQAVRAILERESSQNLAANAFRPDNTDPPPPPSLRNFPARQRREISANSADRRSELTAPANAGFSDNTDPPPTVATVMAKISCESCDPPPLSLLVEFFNPLGARYHSDAATLTVTPPHVVSLIWIVVQKGDLPELEEQLNSGLESSDNDGQTPLHHAAAANRHALARILLGNGAEVNPQNNSDQTPLDLAINNNSAETQTVILQYGGVCAQTQNEKCPGLHETARTGSRTGVAILLAQQPPPGIDARNENSNTPLLIAAANGHPDIVELLLQNGAAVNVTNILGAAPLHLAAAVGDAESAAVLLRHSAEPNIKNNDGQTPMDFAADAGHFEVRAVLAESYGVCAASQSPNCPNLHDAVLAENITLVSVLLQVGAFINQPDDQGRAPLDLVVDNENSQTRALLLQNGAICLQSEAPACPRGLLDAANEGLFNRVTVLLAAGENPDQQDPNGNAPLHLAAAQGHVEIVSVLLEYNASINAENNAGNTPLHQAAFWERAAAAVTLLLQNGAQVNPRNADGKTPLDRFFEGGQDRREHTRDFLIEHGGICSGVAAPEIECPHLNGAAADGNLTLVVELLKNGSNINAKIDDTAPLHRAAENGHLHIVRYLIENGAELNPEHAARGTPLDLAVEDHPEIRRLLIDLGGICLRSGHAQCPNLRTAAANGNLAQITILLARQPPPNIDGRGQFGETALHWAARYGHQNIAALLLTNSASINAAAENNATPLDWAVLANQRAMQTFLQNRGAQCRTSPFGAAVCGYLHEAVIDGNEARVTLLLDGGALPNEKNDDGKTPLDLAFEGAHPAIQTALISANGICAEVENDQCPPDLHDAANDGSADRLTVLLAAGADVNSKKPFIAGSPTPLHVAAARGRLTVAQILLDNGASVTLKNGNGDTPIHLAASQRRFPLVSLLLARGTPVDIRNGENRTPLHIAGQSTRSAEELDIARLLLEYGADINATGYLRRTPTGLAVLNNRVAARDFLIDNGGICVDLYQQNSQCPSLHTFARNGNLAALNELLDLDSNSDVIDAQDALGRTPLYLAAENGHADIAFALLNNLAQVDLKNNDGYAPLHLAAANGHADIAALLLDDGANVSIVESFDGNTPLHLAVKNGHADIAALLLDNNAPADLKNTAGRAALHDATRNGRAAVVSVLIEGGANINEKETIGGDTPLHLAAGFGYLNVMSILLDNNAAIDVRDRNDATPLHRAAGSARTAAASLLLENGAAVNPTAVDGNTPLDLAAGGGQSAIPARDILIRHGGYCVKGFDCRPDLTDEEALKYCTLGNEMAHCPSLFQLTSDGNYAALSALLRTTVMINARQADNKTALNLAIEADDARVRDLLLEYGGECATRASDYCLNLFEAAWGGHLTVAAVLLSVGRDANQRDRHQATPLHLAAERGHSAVVSLLLSSGALVTAVDTEGETPLHDAADAGHLAVVSILLANGADARARTNLLQTPLHWAASRGYALVASVLLDNGAEVNAENRVGHTPLDFVLIGSGDSATRALLIEQGGICAESGHTECPANLHQAAANGNLARVSMLLETGNSPVNAADSSGNTALHWASRNGHSTVAAYLLSAGADIGARDGEGDTPLHRAAEFGRWMAATVLLTAGATVNARNDGGAGPLHLASRGGHLEAVSLLLSEGGLATLQNNNGATPLHWGADGGNAPVVSVLLAEGGLIEGANAAGRRPLHFASQSGRAEAVSILLESGALVDSMDSDGETPLYEAAVAGRTDAAAILLANGAGVNATTGAGWTPLDGVIGAGGGAELLGLLSAAGGICMEVSIDNAACPDNLHEASAGGDVARMRVLISVGLDVDAKEGGPDDGRAPLHYAAGNGRADAVSLLLASNAAANARDDSFRDRTALHWAVLADMDNYVVASVLLGSGADAALADASARTPLHYAAFAGDFRVVSLLIGAGAETEARDNADDTPLLDTTYDGWTEAASVLLMAGANVNAVRGGRTPLDWAIVNRHGAEYRDLLAAHGGICVGVEDSSCPPDLHASVMDGMTLRVSLLLSASVNVDMRDGDGETALHKAAAEGDSGLALLLLSVGGASVDVANDEGNTPLHLAAVGGDVMLASVLLDYGAGVSATNAMGVSPLHMASGGAHMEVVSLLLGEDGVLVNAEDNAGETPLDVAVRRHWAEGDGAGVIRILRDAGGRCSGVESAEYCPAEEG